MLAWDWAESISYKGLEDKEVEAYYKYMVDAAVYMGADQETAEMELKKSVIFEIELAGINMPKEERRNKTVLNNKVR